MNGGGELVHKSLKALWIVHAFCDLFRFVFYMQIKIKRVDGKPLQEMDLKFPLEVITNHGNNLVHKEEHNISADGNVILDLFIPVTRQGSFTIKVRLIFFFSTQLNSL